MIPHPSFSKLDNQTDLQHGTIRVDISFASIVRYVESQTTLKNSAPSKQTQRKLYSMKSVSKLEVSQNPKENEPDFPDDPLQDDFGSITILKQPLTNPIMITCKIYFVNELITKKVTITLNILKGSMYTTYTFAHLKREMKDKNLIPNMDFFFTDGLMNMHAVVLDEMDCIEQHEGKLKNLALFEIPSQFQEDYESNEKVLIKFRYGDKKHANNGYTLFLYVKLTRTLSEVDNYIRKMGLRYVQVQRKNCTKDSFDIATFFSIGVLENYEKQDANFARQRQLDHQHIGRLSYYGFSQINLIPMVQHNISDRTIPTSSDKRVKEINKLPISHFCRGKYFNQDKRELDMELLPTGRNYESSFYENERGMEKLSDIHIKPDFQNYQLDCTFDQFEKLPYNILICTDKGERGNFLLNQYENIMIKKPKLKGDEKKPKLKGQSYGYYMYRVTALVYTVHGSASLSSWSICYNLDLDKWVKYKDGQVEVMKTSEIPKEGQPTLVFLELMI